MRKKDDPPGNTEFCITDSKGISSNKNLKDGQGSTDSS